MARTGQPAVRHVAAVERAFAVLDALADGGELGTNEIARRTGINASTVSRLLATLASARFVEHVPGERPLPPLAALVELGNAVLGGLDLRRSPARTCRPSCGRPARRRRCRLRASTTRSPSTSPTAPPSSERRPARPAERRACDGDRQGDARVRRRGASRRAVHGIHARTRSRRGRRSSRSSSRVREARLRGGREEREEDLAAIAAPVWDSSGELAGIVGVQGPASRFDAGAMSAAVPLLLEHAVALSTEIGWRRP